VPECPPADAVITVNNASRWHNEHGRPLIPRTVKIVGIFMNVSDDEVSSDETEVWREKYDPGGVGGNPWIENR
jgi:hypothetical protein